MRASPRAVTLGEGGDPFFLRIFLKKAEGRLNRYEMDLNFYSVLKHDCMKRFVKEIGTENFTEAPENHKNHLPTKCDKSFTWWEGL